MGGSRRQQLGTGLAGEEEGQRLGKLGWREGGNKEEWGGEASREELDLAQDCGEKKGGAWEELG